MSTTTDKARRGGFVDYLLEREDVKAAWHDYTFHEFVQRIGDGTLPLDSFREYLIQGEDSPPSNSSQVDVDDSDYLFLVSFDAKTLTQWLIPPSQLSLVSMFEVLINNYRYNSRVQTH